MKIFLILIPLIILINLAVSTCTAEEFSLPAFNIPDAFIKIKDCIIDEVLALRLFAVPKVQRSDIFKAIEETNRSVAKTSTCL